MSVGTFSLTVHLLDGEQICITDSSRICSNRAEIIKYASELGAYIVDNYNINFTSPEPFNKFLKFIINFHPLGDESDSEPEKERVTVFVNDSEKVSVPKNRPIKESWDTLVGEAKFFKAVHEGNNFYFSNDSSLAQQFVNNLVGIAFYSDMD